MDILDLMKSIESARVASRDGPPRPSREIDVQWAGILSAIDSFRAADNSNDKPSTRLTELRA